MDKADALSKNREPTRPLGAEEPTSDWYQGVDLTPCTLESLVTWDVSAHARREQDRLRSLSSL